MPLSSGDEDVVLERFCVELPLVALSPAEVLARDDAKSALGLTNEEETHVLVLDVSDKILKSIRGARGAGIQYIKGAIPLPLKGIVGSRSGL